jgi:hypothetical protein
MKPYCIFLENINQYNVRIRQNSSHYEVIGTYVFLYQVFSDWRSVYRHVEEILCSCFGKKSALLICSSKKMEYIHIFIWMWQTSEMACF